MTMMHDESGEAVGVVSVNRPVLPPLDLRDGPVGLDAGDVRRGLDAQEFEVHYQPVVALADGSLLAVEALVRWQHPVRGVLRPDAFIETAERNGLIIELGAFVLDTASRQVAAWRASGANVGLSMNVSATELADPGLVDRIIVTIDAAGLEPHALWLEVTETTLVRDVDQAAAMLHRLADLGIGIAIDDFGTGWASLTYLSKFPIHALKIDRIFVSGIDENANDRVIARSIVQLGAELGLAVVAEGIETVTQCEAVQALGCLVGQGHLLGRPTPADAVPLHLAPRLETVDAAVDLLRQAERLTEETNHDLLTGLANRRVLDRVLPRIDDGVIVMIDLDHFKAVNDGSGHAAGDAVLARFGRMLADEVRTSDTTCRVGGEEFVMVLPGVDVATAVELVDRIRGTWVLAAPQPITFSAGMAAVSDTGGTAAFLAADQAMYLAKSNGRNRTELAADR